MSADSQPAATPLHVALAADRAYLPWVATAILSAIWATTERPVAVHLLHPANLDEFDLGRMRSMVDAAGATIRFHELDEGSLGRLPAAVQAHGGAISCARFLLPDLLGDLSRVIYLDADTLTLGSLEALWTLPLDDVALGAVRNVVEPTMRPRIQRLGVRDPVRYLNSGLLVMNLNWMRREDSTKALLSYIHACGDQLLWVDQDALNVVLGDDWRELHPRWNVQNSFWGWEQWAREVFAPDDLVQAKQEPSILHFEGPSLCKPWHYLCVHPYLSRYRDTLRATPWADQSLTDRTLLTMMLRWLPQAQRRKAFLRLQRA